MSDVTTESWPTGPSGLQVPSENYTADRAELYRKQNYEQIHGKHIKYKQLSNVMFYPDLTIRERQ